MSPQRCPSSSLIEGSSPRDSISPNSSGKSTPTDSDNIGSNNADSTSDTDCPPCKYRSLAEIYESCTFALLSAEPLNYEEAQGKEEWELSMTEEMAAIKRNDTWELVKLPPGKAAVGVKWVYKVKYNADGRCKNSKQDLLRRAMCKDMVLIT